MATWGFEEDAILHGLEIGNDLSQCSEDRLDREKVKKKSSAKRKRNKKEDQPTLKKPRSPYNLFFNVERELVMAELNCPSGSSFLSELKSNTSTFPQTSLALEDAVCHVPLPDRYRGANLLNPVLVIKSGTRKHRKVHGKIGFVELSQTIAKRWKDADDNIKAYFKALSQQDLQRHKIELERLIDREKLVDKNRKSASKAITTERPRVKVNTLIKKGEIPLVNDNVKSVTGAIDSKSSNVQGRCMGSNSEPNQMEALTANQEITLMPPAKLLGQQSLLVDNKTYLDSCASSHKTPTLLDSNEDNGRGKFDFSEYEPRMFSPLLLWQNVSKPHLSRSDHCDLKSETLDTYLESANKDDMGQFLSYLVNE